MSVIPRKPLVGVALGSGSARGWAHFGVLRALREAGIRPDIVCGTSIGALVGAAHAAGEADRFEEWVLGLGMRKVFGFMDFNLGGGMLKGERIIDFWREHFVQETMEQLGAPFGCVATDLHTGAEVWLRKGSIADAVRASIALPGLFTPVMRDGRWLVDGGLVNPVPVSLARAMGADVVIAVDLNADLMRRHMRAAGIGADLARVDRQQPLAKSGVPADDAEPAFTDLEPPAGMFNANVPPMGWSGKWKSSMTSVKSFSSSVLKRGMHKSEEEEALNTPSLLNVVMSSVNIMQMRITRSRMAGDPSEVLIAPKVAHIGLLDFHRAQEAIDEGYAAAKAALPALRDWGV